MNIFLLTAVSPESADEETVLESGVPFATLDGAKNAAQHDETKAWREDGAEGDEPILAWEQADWSPDRWFVQECPHTGDALLIRRMVVGS